MPADLTLRELRVRITQKGFRTRELLIVTTLLDADQYPPTQIAQLYRRRWQAELNLRSLKIVLQMDHLRCKTPHRARNEFFRHLIAYNLIRQRMALAAPAADVEPWTVSFKGTLQTINNSCHYWARASPPAPGAKHCCKPLPPMPWATGRIVSNRA